MPSGTTRGISYLENRDRPEFPPHPNPCLAPVMKTKVLGSLATVCLLATFLIPILSAGSKEEESEAPPGSLADYEIQLKADEAARSKDPKWKPAFEQIDTIRVGKPGSQGALANFCLNAQGQILVCWAPGKAQNAVNGSGKPGIRVYSPKGELVRTIPLDIEPSAICTGPEGSLFVAGDGRIIRLDSAGKVMASAASPVADLPVSISSELEQMLEESARAQNVSVAEEKKRMLTSLEQRRSEITGLAATDTEVFMAVPAPTDFSFRVYRFDHALSQPKLVVEKLRGCCGQMDIQTRDGKLWTAHNARHRVECRDRDGTQVSAFGKAGRVKATDFGGCCEPKNLRLLANGDILAAESGPPTCIKRFSSDGKFLGVVALVPGKGECVRVTVEASPDGSRFYLLDTHSDAIRVFGTKA